MKIVITGGTTGFGRALVDAFLNKGDTVVFCSSVEKNVEETIKQFEIKYSDKIFGMVCDVSNYDQVVQFTDFAFDTLNKVDIWINNAGTSGYKKANLTDEDLKTINRIVEVNLLGTLYCSKIVLNKLIDQHHGHLFNTEGWGSDGETTKNHTVYGATKAGILQLTKTLSKEAEDNNIGVHTVSPGIVMTRLLITSNDSRSPFFFNTFAELPETVAEALIDRIREITGTGMRIRYLTKLSAIFRVLTFWRFRNKFLDKTGEFVKQELKERINKERNKEQLLDTYD